MLSAIYVIFECCSLCRHMRSTLTSWHQAGRSYIICASALSSKVLHKNWKGKRNKGVTRQLRGFLHWKSGGQLRGPALGLAVKQHVANGAAMPMPPPPPVRHIIPSHEIGPPPPVIQDPPGTIPIIQQVVATCLQLPGLMHNMLQQQQQQQHQMEAAMSLLQQNMQMNHQLTSHTMQLMAGQSQPIAMGADVGVPVPDVAEETPDDSEQEGQGQAPAKRHRCTGKVIVV